MATRSTALIILLTLSTLACGGDAQPGDTTETTPPGDTDAVNEVDTTVDTDGAAEVDTTPSEIDTEADTDTSLIDGTLDPDTAETTPDPDGDTHDLAEAEVSPPTSVEALVGPEGGELAFEGARLVVPAGALVEPTTLRLIRTDLPIPSGYTGYSARWRFEPAGLEFATPARVELPFEGQPTRATIFWSNRDGLGHAWRPTSVVDRRAVAQIEHFSDGFVGDGSDYEEAVDATCVRTRVLHGRKVDPSGIGLFFGVEDCEGRPVRDLPQAAFRVIEGGSGLGAEAQATLLAKPGQLALVSIVLDLSASSDAFRPQLIAAARRFVTTLHERLPGRVVVSVEYFAAMVDSVHTGRYTVDLAETLAALTTLETLAVSQPNGINLHGALMNALARAETARTSRRSWSAGGALLTSHVVVFTDSDDTTKKFTAAEVQAAVLASPTHVVGVGLQGPDYDPVALAALAPDGLFEASAATGLELAFAGALNRVVGQSEATYFLAYCTPTVVGEHEVHLEVNGAELESSRGWTFTASAAGQSCTVDRFLDACSGVECGGFACGVCDERVDECRSGQCEPLCVLEGRCGEFPHTNGHGYASSCPDTEIRASCGTAFCQNLTNNRNHCGDCDNVCPSGGSCLNSACVCPTNHLACDDLCYPILTSEVHCGACGNSCAQGATCQSGTCLCPSSQRPCSGVCRSTDTDEANCGTCGNTCVPGATCYSGVCRCPTGEAICGGRCTKVLTDRSNCGNCGLSCQLGCDGGQCLIVSDIHLGNEFTCARTQRGPFCWGSNASGQLGTSSFSSSRNPTKGPVGAPTALGLGHVHVCAQLTNGTVTCWGGNSFRQLARPNIGASTSAEAVSGLTGVVKLWVGGNSNCAAKADGKVHCWGSNSKGQLAYGVIGNLSSQTQVPALAGAKQIALNVDHSCAIMADDSVSCFGNNQHGQVGLEGGGETSNPNPVAGLTSVTQVATGREFSCAVQGGEVFCWGRNERGQLGDGSTVSRSTATRVLGLDRVTRIHVGARFACAERTDAGLWCWGDTTPFDGINYSSNAVQNTGVSSFVAVAAGPNHMCLRRANGVVACWGRNGSGELGTGTTVPMTNPEDVVWQ